MYNTFPINRSPKTFGLPFWIAILISVFFFGGCIKPVEAPSSSQKYFFRQFPEKGDEQAQFIDQTKDGGYLIIGAARAAGTNEYTIYVSKTDAFGNEIWKRDDYNVYIPFITSLGVRLNNGNYFLTGVVYGTNLEFNYLIVNENGDVVTGPNFIAQNYSIEDPCNAGGKYYLGMSNGRSSYNSNNWIVGFSPTGTKNVVSIGNATFGYKILKLAVYNANELSAAVTNYWVCGEIYPKNNWLWSDNSKVFFARMKNGIPGKVEILNLSNDSTGSDVLNAWLALPDTGIIAAYGINSFYDFSFAQNNSFQLVKYDKELNEVWSKKINLNGFTSLIAHIRPCKGGFLLMGSSVLNGTSQQPLLIKIDENGNILWWHTYNTTFQGRAGDAHENEDGSIIICGYTFAFGNSNQSSDVFLIKTDAKGELK